MRDFTQILAKTLGIFFLVFFSVLSAFGQSALRLVVPIVSPACFNGADDDSDGFVDYPDDADCANQNDPSEHHLAATCSASSSTIQLGQSVVWTVVPTGGSTTYTYLWFGEELNETTAQVAKTYTTAGTKNATVMVTSGLDSVMVGCSSSVTVNGTSSIPPRNTPSSGISGPSIPLTTIPTIPIPVLDSAPTENQNMPFNKTFARMCDTSKVKKTFYDYKEDVLCEGFITKRSQESGYEYEKTIPRKELVAIALNMRKIPMISPDEYSYYYTDLGKPGEAPWILPLVETARAYGLILSGSTQFHPDANPTRAESFETLMRAVCYPMFNKKNRTWQRNIFNAAKQNNITTRSWEDFEADKPVLRQEIFVIASRLADWADMTGGCGNPKYTIPMTQSDNSELVKSALENNLEVPATKSSNISIRLDVDTSEQLPGTFAILNETDTETIFSYIVRSGGTPDGVRAQYLKTFGLSKKSAKKLTIRDINGAEYSEDRWFLPRELVFVYLKK